MDGDYGGGGYDGGNSGGGSSGEFLKGSYADNQMSYRVVNIVNLIVATIALAFIIIDFLTYQANRSDYDLVSQVLIVIIIGFALWLLVSIIGVVISLIQDPRRCVHYVITIITIIDLIAISISYKIIRSTIQDSQFSNISLKYTFAFEIALHTLQGMFNVVMAAKLRS